MSKNYSQSPLPFQGQKRRFVKHFKTSLKSYNDKYIFIDLFGGSGLLSHTVKIVFPNAKVVYNDFDNFKQRLNTIESTNEIVAKLREMLRDYPRNKRITGKHRDKVVNLLKQAEESEYVDWITLSSSLKFSMNYGTCLKDFTNDTLYNKVRLSDYNADGYLQGVEVVRMDYKILFEQYKEYDNVVFLVDPPYLSTDSSTYGSDGYWKLQDYLDVLFVLVNQNYFYFTSDKSQIVELCDWISNVSTTASFC